MDSDLHPAYLAGIIDGEGSIMLPRTGNRKLDGVWRSFTIKISIANTDMNLLHAIRDCYGGRIEKSRNNLQNHKPCYRINWFGGDAIKIISTIYPYLIVKKDVADLVKQFASLRDEYGYNKEKTKAQIFKLGEIASLVKTRNRRGI